MNNYDVFLSAFNNGVFKTPHKYKDRVFATDGHIFIDVPISVCEKKYKTQNRIKNPLIVTNVKMLSEPKVFNAAEIHSRLTITDLDFITAFGNCKSCEGLGDCECICGHQHSCANCNGTGKSQTNANFVKVDGKPFQFQYFQYVLTAAAKFNNNEFQIVSDTEIAQQTVFIAGQMRLTIMPIRETHDRFIELA